MLYTGCGSSQAPAYTRPSHSRPKNPHTFLKMSCSRNWPRPGRLDYLNSETEGRHPPQVLPYQRGSPCAGAAGVVGGALCGLCSSSGVPGGRYFIRDHRTFLSEVEEGRLECRTTPCRANSSRGTILVAHHRIRAQLAKALGPRRTPSVHRRIQYRLRQRHGAQPKLIHPKYRRDFSNRIQPSSPTSQMSSPYDP